MDNLQAYYCKQVLSKAFKLFARKMLWTKTRVFRPKSVRFQRTIVRQQASLQAVRNWRVSYAE